MILIGFSFLGLGAFTRAGHDIISNFKLNGRHFVHSSAVHLPALPLGNCGRTDGANCNSGVFFKYSPNDGLRGFSETKISVKPRF
jgi:hypothetical protein